MTESPAIIKNNKIFIIIKLLFCLWFFYLTAVNLVTIKSFNGLIIKVLPSCILFCFLLLLNLSTKSIDDIGNPKFNLSNIFDPLLLYIVYLSWGSITLLNTTSSSALFFRGFGYLFSFIIVLMIAASSYSIMLKRQVVVARIDLKPGYRNPVCEAAFWAASLILLYLGYKALTTGTLLTEERLLLLGEMLPASIGIISLLIIVYTITYRPSIINIGISLIAIILLFKGESRTSTISVFVSCLMILAIKIRKLSLLVIFGLIIVIIFLLFHNFISDRILFLHDPTRGQYSLSGRAELWKIGLKIIQQHYIMGIGFKLGPSWLGAKGIGYIHNGYLDSLIETGVVGTLLLIATYFFTLIRLLRLSWRYRDRSSLFFLGILIGLLIYSMGEDYLSNIGNMTSIMVFFAIFHSRINFTHAGNKG